MRERPETRGGLFIATSSIIPGMIWGANSIIVPLYLKQLGLSPLRIGVLMASAVIVSSFISLVASFLADSMGRKPVAITLGSLYSLGLFLLFSGQPLGYLVAGGFGGGSVKQAWTSDLYGKSTPKIFSYVNFGSTLASTLGSFTVSFLNYRGLLALDVFLELTSIVLLLPVPETLKERRRVSLKMESLSTVFKFSVESLVGLGAGMVIPIMSLWFNLRFNLTAQDLSPLYTISNLSLAVGGIVAERISRRTGVVRTVVITEAMAIALLVILPLSPSVGMAEVVYVLRNVLMNMTGPIRSSFLLSLVKEDEKARAEGITNLFHSLPRAAGPAIGGYFFQLGDLSLPFFITASLYSASVIGFFMMFKKVERI